MTKIGQFVKRSGRPLPWHLVESVIANDAITTCGRRMPDESNTRGELFARDNRPPTAYICRYCLKGGA